MTISLPRHKRASSPPAFRLTPRDRAVIDAVHAYRVLRRDQIQGLFFPSRNTANERLKRLYHHGYLARRWLAMEQGQGSSQALYLLAAKGTHLVAQRLAVDVSAIGWKHTHNHVSSLFLDHTLMVNDVRVALDLAARRSGSRVERWVTEESLKRSPDRVIIEPKPGQRRRVALIPDAYFRLVYGGRRAHFFLEADRATETNGRWAQKALVYLAYVRSGAYARRYATDCLRVLTVTTSAARLGNLLRTTQEAAGGHGAARLFWFATLDDVAAATILAAPIWRVPGEQGPMPLITLERREVLVPSAAPQLLFAA